MKPDSSIALRYRLRVLEASQAVLRAHAAPGGERLVLVYTVAARKRVDASEVLAKLKALEETP